MPYTCEYPRLLHRVYSEPEVNSPMYSTSDGQIKRLISIYSLHYEQSLVHDLFSLIAH